MEEIYINFLGEIMAHLLPSYLHLSWSNCKGEVQAFVRNQYSFLKNLLEDSCYLIYRIVLWNLERFEFSITVL